MAYVPRSQEADIIEFFPFPVLPRPPQSPGCLYNLLPTVILVRTGGERGIMGVNERQRLSLHVKAEVNRISEKLQGELISCKVTGYESSPEVLLLRRFTSLQGQ